MSKTGFVYHDTCVNHNTGPEHPEKPERLIAIRERLQGGGVWQELLHHKPSVADDRWIVKVHDADYVRRVAKACQKPSAVLDGGDTVVSPQSDVAARLAAGGVMQAIDRVMAQEWDNAFTAVRPPGHHAEHLGAMGFCLYNNVAVGARYLREHHGLDKVAIVDFDVHHGNGTQHLFEEDPSVFFASLHQFPHYPGTGAAAERGRGPGEGATLNCPMKAGTKDADWLAVFEQKLLPELDAFAPDFLLISAGFDAHASDPLSATKLTESGYRGMTQLLLDVARRHCSGRAVAVLEGGYHMEALASSVETHLQELLKASS
jgi:acetoin utilization deacetylase AcuC-like enzyme